MNKGHSSVTLSRQYGVGKDHQNDTAHHQTTATCAVKIHIYTHADSFLTPRTGAHVTVNSEEKRESRRHERCVILADTENKEGYGSPADLIIGLTMMSLAYHEHTKSNKGIENTVCS